MDQTTIETEPLLKYHRIGGVVADINSTRDETENSVQDKVSCVLTTPKYLLLGTVNGLVYQTNFRGVKQRVFDSHSAAVTDISVDDSLRYFASSSDDGCVCLIDLDQSQERAQIACHKFHFAVKAVAIDPAFATRREKVFGSGGIAETCILTKRGWFKTEHRELHKGEGTVHAMDWRGNLIAWANDMGVKIFNYENEQRVAFVKRPSSPPSSICPSRLQWLNEHTLLLGWGTTIKVVSLKPANRTHISVTSARVQSESKAVTSTSKSRAPPVKLQAQVVVWFETDFYVCGIAPFGDDRIALLGYVPNDDDEDESNEEHVTMTSTSSSRSSTSDWSSKLKLPCASNPELRIISCSDGAEVSSDSLPLTGFEQFQPFNYGLSWSNELCNGESVPLLYIYSPKEVVAARPLQLMDRIQAAVQGEHYLRAVELAGTTSTDNTLSHHVDLASLFRSSGETESLSRTDNPYSLKHLVGLYLRHLLDEGEFVTAARELFRLVPTDVDQWSHWVTEFHKLGALVNLAYFVPYPEPGLGEGVYDLIIDDLIDVAPTVLVRTLLSWCSQEHKEMFQSQENPISHQWILDVSSGLPNQFSFSRLPVDSKFDCLFTLPKACNHLSQKLKSAELEIGSSEWLGYRDAYVILMQLSENPKEAFSVALETASHLKARDCSSDTEHICLVFGLIEKYKLVSSVKSIHGDMLKRLLALDQDKAIDTLVSVFPLTVDDDDGFLEEGLSNQLSGMLPDSTSSTSTSDVLVVVEEIRNDSELLFRYLDRIFTSQKGVYNHPAFGHLHDFQIEQYAANGMEQKLSKLLKWSNYYSLEHALEVCENHSPAPLYPEIVQILGRMGGQQNLERALEIILQKMRDVPKALEFLRSEHRNTMETKLDVVQGEGEQRQSNGVADGERADESSTEQSILDALVRLCSSDAELVGQLLEYASAFDVDKSRLVESIPMGLMIPSLCERLLKLLENVSLELEVIQGCNSVLLEDITGLFRELQRLQCKGVAVPVGASCGLCTRHIRPMSGTFQHSRRGEAGSKLVVFGSGDCYHAACLQESFDTVSALDNSGEVGENDELSKLKRHCILYADAMATNEGGEVERGTVEEGIRNQFRTTPIPEPHGFEEFANGDPSTNGGKADVNNLLPQAQAKIAPEASAGKQQRHIDTTISDTGVEDPVIS